MSCESCLSCKSCSGFHLVIERLFMSGCCQQRRLQSRWERYNVSISFSSGFSCQGNAVSDVSPLGNLSLFPSRYRAASHFRRSIPCGIKIKAVCFHLVIERLLISGSLRLRRFARTAILFQSRYRAASHFRITVITTCARAIMFQSRYRAASHFRALFSSSAFRPRAVSISLSSGFSFQENKPVSR